ncbi:uncharacterized protein LOC135828084 [Sycon ciliatum]|uniref:uncharacterized protein LOC135828084 n=1 Tax=Sycon ciliatum TaxID=27933 RepID=UPI0031F6BB52
MFFQSGGDADVHGGTNMSTEDDSDLLVFGYGCRLFHNDAAAKMVNRGETLIPWQGDNSLLIDRYDGRAHFFSASEFLPTVPSREISWKHPDADIERLLEEERYRDARADAMERRVAEEEVQKRALLPLTRYSEQAPAYDTPPEQATPPAGAGDQADQNVQESVISRLASTKAKPAPYALAPASTVSKVASSGDYPADDTAADGTSSAHATSPASSSAGVEEQTPSEPGDAATPQESADTDAADADAAAAADAAQRALFVPPEGLKIPSGTETPSSRRILSSSSWTLVTPSTPTTNYLKNIASGVYRPVAEQLKDDQQMGSSIKGTLAQQDFQPVVVHAKPVGSSGGSNKAEKKGNAANNDTASTDSNTDGRSSDDDDTDSEEDEGFSGLHPSLFAASHRPATTTTQQSAKPKQAQAPASASRTAAKPKPVSAAVAAANTRKEAIALVAAKRKKSASESDHAAKRGDTVSPRVDSGAPQKKIITAKDLVAMRLAAATNPLARPTVTKMVPIATVGEVTRDVSTAPSSNRHGDNGSGGSRDSGNVFSSAPEAESMSAASPRRRCDGDWPELGSGDRTPEAVTSDRHGIGEDHRHDGDDDDPQEEEEDVDGEDMLEEWPTRDMLAAVAEQEAADTSSGVAPSHSGGANGCGQQQQQQQQQQQPSSSQQSGPGSGDGGGGGELSSSLAPQSVSNPGFSQAGGGGGGGNGSSGMTYPGPSATPAAYQYPVSAAAAPTHAHNSYAYAQQYGSYYAQQQQQQAVHMSAGSQGVSFPGADPYVLAAMQAPPPPPPSDDGGVSSTIPASTACMWPTQQQQQQQQHAMMAGGVMPGHGPAVVSVNLPFVPPPPPDDEDEDYDNESVASPALPDSCPDAPTEDEIRIVIDKLAEYVARNGRDFEKCVVAKGDPKFSFLRRRNPLYPYYAWRRRDQQRELAKQAAREAKPLSSSKTKTSLGTVSFKLFKKTNTASSGLQPGVQFSDDDSEEEVEEVEETAGSSERKERGAEGNEQQEPVSLPHQHQLHQQIPMLGAYPSYHGSVAATGSNAEARPSGVMLNSSSSWLPPAGQPGHQHTPMVEEDGTGPGEDSAAAASSDIQAERRRRASAFKQRMLRQQQQLQEGGEQEQLASSDNTGAPEFPISAAYSGYGENDRSSSESHPRSHAMAARVAHADAMGGSVMMSPRVDDGVRAERSVSSVPWQQQSHPAAVTMHADGEVHHDHASRPHVPSGAERHAPPPRAPPQQALPRFPAPPAMSPSMPPPVGSARMQLAAPPPRYPQANQTVPPPHHQHHHQQQHSLSRPPAASGAVPPLSFPPGQPPRGPSLGAPPPLAPPSSSATTNLSGQQSSFPPPSSLAQHTFSATSASPAWAASVPAPGNHPPPWQHPPAHTVPPSHGLPSSSQSSAMPAGVSMSPVVTAAPPPHLASSSSSSAPQPVHVQTPTAAAAAPVTRTPQISAAPVRYDTKKS